MTDTVLATSRQHLEGHWLRVVDLSVIVCVVGLAVFFVAGTFFATVSEGDFTHTADYWYAASGIAMAMAGIGIALGIHRLQRGADGRLGTVGVWINTVALFELLVQLGATVSVGSELRWGPTYIVSSFFTFLGVALLAGGSWRTGILPRWMLGVWPVLWLLGSFAGTGPVALLLAAFLIAMAVMLRRCSLNPDADKGCTSAARTSA